MRGDVCSSPSSTRVWPASMAGRLSSCLWGLGGPEQDGLVATRFGPLFWSPGVIPALGHGSVGVSAFVRAFCWISSLCLRRYCLFVGGDGFGVSGVVGVAAAFGAGRQGSSCRRPCGYPVARRLPSLSVLFFASLLPNSLLSLCRLVSSTFVYVSSRCTESFCTVVQPCCPPLEYVRGTGNGQYRRSPSLPTHPSRIRRVPIGATRNECTRQTQPHALSIHTDQGCSGLVTHHGADGGVAIPAATPLPSSASAPGPGCRRSLWRIKSDRAANVAPHSAVQANGRSC